MAAVVGTVEAEGMEGVEAEYLMMIVRMNRHEDWMFFFLDFVHIPVKQEDVNTPKYV